MGRVKQVEGRNTMGMVRVGLVVLTALFWTLAIVPISPAADLSGKFGLGFQSEAAFPGLATGALSGKYWINQNIGLQVTVAGFWTRLDGADFNGALPSLHILGNLVKRQNTNFYIGLGGGPVFFSNDRSDTGAFGKLRAGVEHLFPDFPNFAVSVEFGVVGITAKLDNDRAKVFSPFMGLGLHYYFR